MTEHTVWIQQSSTEYFMPVIESDGLHVGLHVVCGSGAKPWTGNLVVFGESKELTVIARSARYASTTLAGIKDMAASDGQLLRDAAMDYLNTPGNVA